MRLSRKRLTPIIPLFIRCLMFDAVFMSASVLASRRDLSSHRGSELQSFAERTNSRSRVAQNGDKISLKHLLELKDLVDENLHVSRRRLRQQNGWKLLWNDDFNETDISNSWSFQTGDGCDIGLCGWGNQELEWYTDRPDNVRTENGELIITAQEEQGSNQQAVQQSCWDDCGQQCAAQGFQTGTADLKNCVVQCGQGRCPAIRFTSGRINTMGKFSVGPSNQYSVIHIAARIKVPTGLGLWPAFWMLPQDPSNARCSGCGVYGPWPAGGEIDIMELGADGGAMKKVTSAIHYGGQGQSLTKIKSRNINPSNYHIYSVTWSEKRITFKINGKVYHTISNERVGKGWFTAGQAPRSTAPFNVPFYILLNMAVGGSYTGYPSADNISSSTFADGPQQMHVDWIRVFGK